jgi:hypothetical protein
MTANSELNIISQTRAEVLAKNVPTGENLFLVWGYPTAVFLFLEFLALTLLGKDWCQWLWVGIPAVGTPLMMYYLNEDYERTGNRSLNSNVILQMWVFVGFVSFLGGVTMGLANVFAQLYCTFQGVLIGMGCFITGVILHFRSKTLCGIVGTVLSFLSLFLQGDLWPWQLLVASAVAVITLIIPGHLFHRYVRNYDK